MGNSKTLKRRVFITSIITLFVFLFDIYLIIYVPTDYILLTAAFVTFVFTILTLSSWFKLKDIENQRLEEHYTDIMKAEKGTYVITLEMLKQLDEKINFIGQKIMPLGKAGDANQRKIASMLDGIVEDQKKIAKITISRTKENADALMNSNDQLLVQMEGFRIAIEAIKEQINKQTQVSNPGNEGFGEIKDELFEKMQELTESIKKEVDEISENIELSNHTVEDLVSKKLQEPVVTQAITSEEKAVMPEAMPEQLPEEETIMPEMAEQLPEEEAVMPEVPEQLPEEEAVIPEVPEQLPEEEIPEEAIPEAIEIDGNDVISELIMEKKPLEDAILSEEESVEEPIPEPAMSDPNKPMSPEDIAELLASTAVESPSENEEAPVEEATPTLVEEEKPPMPDMSDPNKPMSPEDIAALIANTAAEDLPDETAKFEEEEKPPMPDMSDPNKPMSPEDIAALIANM